MSPEEADPFDPGLLDYDPAPHAAGVQEAPVRTEGSAFDIVDLKRELTTQAARDARAELEHVKKLLSAQDAAKQHAQATAAQLQKQLKSLEADNNRLRAELKRALDQVGLSKQDANVELSRASEREQALRRELTEVRNEATKALDKASGRKMWVTVSLGMGVCGFILAWFILVRPAGLSGGTHDEASVDPVVVEAKPPVSDRSKADRSKPDWSMQGGPHDFSAGLARLDKALDSFKGEKPEDILERVHVQNAAKGITVCSFKWNNGDPTLQFDAREGLDLNTAMTRCADAVAKSAK